MCSSSSRNRGGANDNKEWELPNSSSSTVTDLHRTSELTDSAFFPEIAFLEEVRDDSGNLENAYIRVRVVLVFVEQSLIDPQINRNFVTTSGHDAVGSLLVELQVLKATADAEGATKFYTELTTPPEGWVGDLRELVLNKKQVSLSLVLFGGCPDCPLKPRKIFVQVC